MGWSQKAPDLLESHSWDIFIIWNSWKKFWTCWESISCSWKWPSPLPPSSPLSSPSKYHTWAGFCFSWWLLLTGHCAQCSIQLAGQSFSFAGVNISQGWIFFMCEYFSWVNIFQFKFRIHTDYFGHCAQCSIQLAGQSFSFAFLQSSLNSNPPPFFLNNKPCIFPLDHEIGVQCDREVDVRHLFICFKVIVIINAYSESFDYGLIAKIKFFLWKWWGRWLFCWPLGCLWCRRRWRLVLECWEEAHTWRSPGKSPTMKRTLSYLKVIVPYIIINHHHHHHHYYYYHHRDAQPFSLSVCANLFCISACINLNFDRTQDVSRQIFKA